MLKYFKILQLLPASPKAKAGQGVQSLHPSVRLSIHSKILSSQLLWNYWSNSHETWYVDRTSYDVMHIGRKFWSPHFCGSYAPWNLENNCKSTNNVGFLCQFFINEITASDAGPDIIRSHLLYIFSVLLVVYRFWFNQLFTICVYFFWFEIKISKRHNKLFLF